MSYSPEVNEPVLEKKKSEKVRKFNKAKLVPYLFITPAVLMVVSFLFYPIGMVFYYSFQNYDISAPYYNSFAGLDNFVNIFTSDKLFFPSLLNSLKWVVTEVGLQLVFGLILALLLNQTFKFRGIIRAVAFIPWAISGVLASVIWSLMYNEHMGVLNDILMRFGIIDSPQAFLASTSTAFGAVVIAELWRGIPFFAITLLAGLQSIPQELYEAARVDGASRWKSFLFVTLPQLKNTIILTTLLRVVWEFNNVDLIFNLTGGGPAHSTTTLTMYIAELAVHGSNFGYGSALTVISFGILLVFAALYLKLSRYEKE
ncbi:multiple sugar transport system permease protein [Solibacillus kalamii]|uniref:ABC-type sugar transport systems, permease component n=3 Tax=Solibacillus TaxID=648800 RepID=F2F0Z8_SOLSS|nr:MULTISPECIES: sugar ABC transporter permease [Solibacillus]AMO85309.1 transporter [Solibacillus silvestris]EKB44037.1 sn-glycerol-3-phosphate transport system permease protein ugpA [Solibacillus isronensis B3W22]MBM7665891.1 multiple sugar transport system permease protein [Solibacillus kalamii]MCM3721557.1 sugar ABC transporter permease [Solibacillus isronensis]OUZ38676.1 sugar ABC transporter permease [Solibacillus kalamii]